MPGEGGLLCTPRSSCRLCPTVCGPQKVRHLTFLSLWAPRAFAPLHLSIWHRDDCPLTSAALRQLPHPVLQVAGESGAPTPGVNSGGTGARFRVPHCLGVSAQGCALVCGQPLLFQPFSQRRTPTSLPQVLLFCIVLVTKTPGHQAKGRKDSQLPGRVSWGPSGKTFLPFSKNLVPPALWNICLRSSLACSGRDQGDTELFLNKCLRGTWVA